MRITLNARKLFGLFFSFTLLTGCTTQGRLNEPQGKVYEPNLKYAEVKRKIVNRSSGFPSDYVLLENVLYLFSGNNDGQLVGTISDPKSGLQLPGLYLISPSKEPAKLVSEIEKGNEVYDAVVNQKWVAWVEKNKNRWKVLSKPLDRLGDSPRLVAEGSYFPEAGEDYPSIALSDDTLCFNSSYIEKDQIVSTISVVDLSLPGKPTVISTDNAVRTYYGPPAIYGDRVVWHKGEWTKEMKGEVLLHSLSTNTTTRLPANNEAISPVIWRDQMLWMGYSRQLPERKYIESYDLNSLKLKRVPEKSDYEFLENWNIMVGDGLATWYSNDPNRKPFVYSLETGDTIEVDVPTTSRQLNLVGEWLYWHEESSGIGIFPTALITRLVGSRR